MDKNGYNRAVCFSCGNASRELVKAGVDVLDISPFGDLEAHRWFTISDVASCFHGFFDATSGHLPMDCMLMVSDEFKSELGDMSGTIDLPTGSGETLVCLKLAYPSLSIRAVYDLDEATKYDDMAPLNRLVAALAEEVVHGLPSN